MVFRPDPAVYDGRFANNGWLQEWPRPITQLTWDNAAIFSPKTAQEKGVVSTDLVEIAYRGYKMRAPVFIQPGHADGSVTVHLGYGRTRAGHVGTRIGFNAYGMRTSAALWQDYGLEARKVGSDYLLVSDSGLSRAGYRAAHHREGGYRGVSQESERDPGGSSNSSAPA